MDTKNIDKLWPHIHWLIMLAQQGSFTSAAKRLSVSKAAMSQRIVELEKATGVALVRRTTRSVHLTEAGRRLVEDTREAYAHIAHSFADVRDMAEVPSGLVRITAPVAFARQQLVARLPAFLQRYPQIRLDLDMQDGLVSLASEGFDLAIRHVDAPPDTYVARALCRTRTLLVASPQYLALHGTPGLPSQLEGHSHLLYPRHHSVATWTFEKTTARGADKRVTANHVSGKYVNGSHGADNRVTVSLRSAFIANNSEVLRDMACAGAGVALLPDFSAQEAVQRGKLIEILPKWRAVGTFGHSIFIVRPYSPRVPRAVRVLQDYLLETFAGGFEAGTHK